MTDDLVAYMATIAQRLVDQEGLTPAQAARQALQLINTAHTEYRALGAPLGDTNEGFLRWLQPRHQPPAA